MTKRRQRENPSQSLLRRGDSSPSRKDLKDSRSKCPRYRRKTKLTPRSGTKIAIEESWVCASSKNDRIPNAFWSQRGKIVKITPQKRRSIEVSSFVFDDVGKGGLSRPSVSVGNWEYIIDSVRFSTHDKISANTRRIEDSHEIGQLVLDCDCRRNSRVQRVGDNPHQRLRFLCVKLLDDSPTVPSLEMCETMGFSHSWNTGQQPLTKDGITFNCRTENHVQCSQ